MANTGLNQGKMVTASSQSINNLKQLSIILLRRRYLILGVSCVVMSMASLMAIMNKPMYQSSMQILVTSKLNEDLSSNNNKKNVENNLTYSTAELSEYTIQLKLMLSSKLMRKVVDLLRQDYPSITPEDIIFNKNKNNKPPLRLTQIEGVTSANNVFSQVFEITFQDQDSLKTQKVLQALQKVYQDYNTQQRQERLHKGLAFVNARLPEIKNKVIQSQNKLEEFRRKHNLFDPQLQSKILLQSLADIQKHLQTTSAQLQDVQTRYSNLKQKMASLFPDTLTSPHVGQSARYQALLNEIEKTELVLAQEQKRYTDASPMVQRLKQQRESQLALLKQEAGKFLAENPSPSNLEEPLSIPGQMAGVDLKLMEEVIQAQTKALGLIANEKSLIESENRLRSELSKYPSLIAEYSRLLPEVETNRKTLEQLLQEQQLLGLQIAQGGFDWQVLVEPQLGTDISNSRILLLLLGMIAGPILGVSAAVIKEILRQPIYFAEELQMLTNLKLLGIVPKLTMGRVKKRLSNLFLPRRSHRYPLVLETSSKLPHHENLEIIYQNIQILKYPSPLKSLMLTSTLVGEGKTTLALGLAATAAHMHRRVLVIDANLRRPRLHKVLEVSNDWGLSLLLVDETNTQMPDYIQPIHPSIDILTAGPLPEDAVMLLSSQRMKEIIALFEQTYDLVLIDAPAMLDVVDARIIAPLCNGILMVTRMGQVSQNELMQAREILSNLNLIGIVANS